jgi:hypothetical protein
MECTKCRKVKNFTEFSYRNKSEKIYYLYCDDCRKNTVELQKKYKERAVEEYNLRKELNVIECNCGISFVCFRDFHMYRHINSKKHKKLLNIE